jgi:hypothetical protein
MNQEQSEKDKESSQAKATVVLKNPGSTRRRRSRWRPQDWVSLGMEVLTLAVLIAYTVYAGRQANTLKVQADLLKLSNESAVTNNAALLAQSADIASKALAESKRQADASLKQAQSNSAASLSLARRSLEVAERAYLNIESVDITFSKGKPVSVTGVVRNVGHTPAKGPHYVCTLFTMNLIDRSLSEAPWGTENESFAPIGPNQTFSYGCQFSQVVVNDSLIERIKEKGVSLQLFTEVVALDEFGNPVLATACYVLEGPSMVFRVCPIKWRRKYILP